MSFIYLSMAEALRAGKRSEVEIHRNGNGLGIKIPIPFEPGDRIDLSALWPAAAYMQMIVYGEQRITMIEHGTGRQEVVYDGLNGSGK